MTEMSQMSEVSSMVQEPAGGDQGSDKKFVATVVILLLLVAALSVFYFSGSSSSASVGGGDGSGDEGGGGEQSDGGSEGSKSSGGFVVSSNPPPPPTPKTPATPRRPTKMVITTSPTPDTFQETPHPPRPVPKKREPYHDLLLCTVSHRALFKEMYPPDGYCELLFYTEAYYESNSGQFLGAYDEISFDVFRRQARSATANNKTTYGVSFIFRSPTDLAAQLRASTAKQKFKELWNDHIYHYGVLHAHGNISDIKSSSRYAVFKEFKAQQDVLGTSKNGHRVLGYQMDSFSSRYTEEQVAFIKSAMQNYPITIFVTITHAFKVYQNSHVRALQAYSSSYLYYDLADMAKVFAGVASSMNNVWIMPSFTMAAGAWTYYNSSTRVNDPEYYTMSWWSPVINVQSCKDTYKQTGEHRSAQSYMFSANNTAKFLLTYDTSETLRRKMEWFFRDVGTLPKKHGWAVYDVDFEDYTNMCYRGNFPRLKAIKRYLEI